MGWERSLSILIYRVFCLETRNLKKDENGDHGFIYEDIKQLIQRIKWKNT